MSVNGAILEAKGVHMSFGGVLALVDTNLSVATGDIHGIVGPNGSGKTTLLNVISRLITPQQGTVRFDGTDLMSKRPHGLASLGITRTFQTPVMFRGMTVLENVLVGMQAVIRGGLWADLARAPSYNRRQQEAIVSARQLMADVLGFTPTLMERKVETLNFAEQRRAELARALAIKPKLVLLDEPA
ncbi:MAG TPA: ATP-binding cassette domain-containing protein, partial [Isosphaeraceae bacterium]|nr:ATP-binding cassette domain-containing protein [Isosphaeraceae bacterium]